MSKSFLPRTIFGQLLLVFAIFGAVMIATLLFVTDFSHELYHEELEQTVNRDLAQRLVAADFLLIDQPLTVDGLHRGIRKLAEANPDVDMYLIDPSGGIVASSVPETRWNQQRIDMAPVQRFLDGEALPILGDDPAAAHRRDVFTAAPLEIEGCPARYLYIVLRRDQQGPSASRLSKFYSLTEGVGFVVFSSLLAIGLSIWFLRILTRRLSVLAREMREFEESGGLALPDRQGGIDRHDEIDGLELSFFNLAIRVRQQMEALRRSDETRRHLMANVSHDLRTPLTTLVTHLEAVTAAGPGLSPEERSSYLQIAMRQSQRVIRLVDQILEAARLEAGQVEMSPEPFVLAELLQDVVQKFRLEAANRGIELRLVLPDDLRWVIADVGLMERVLDNLLENALRFAPRGSAVTVSLTDHREMLTVSVADSGVGLAPEDAARVAERFFRKDPGRSSPSGHAGLGLAIVQGILQLHGSHIRVVSQPGHGATFSFDLAACETSPSPDTKLQG